MSLEKSRSPHAASSASTRRRVDDDVDDSETVPLAKFHFDAGDAAFDNEIRMMPVTSAAERTKQNKSERAYRS